MSQDPSAHATSMPFGVVCISTGEESADEGPSTASDAGNDSYEVHRSASNPDVLDRRSLLKSTAILLGGELASPALRSVTAVTLNLAETLETARLTPAVLDSIQLATDYYSRSFDRHNFHDLRAVLTQHLEAVDGLLRRPAKYRQRRELCLYGERISGMLALVTHMQGNLSECLAHYSNAFMLAEEIGDRAFMSWVVAERAAVAWSVGNAAAVLRLTETFVDKTRGANRANMVSNTALAFARTGDHSQAKSFISEAETLAHTIPEEQNSDLPGTPIWGFSPSSTITNTAIAWLNLREPRRALESAQNAELLLGDQGLYRHRVHAKIIMATSYAALGEPEEASRLATDVILSSPQDVYIVSGQSLDLLQALRKYRSTPAVRQLHEVISFYENKLEEGS
jgi:hypothetical protein